MVELPDGMTVGQLRKAIENLPDDMVVATYDQAGDISWEFCGADVVAENTPGRIGPPLPCLLITAA